MHVFASDPFVGLDRIPRSLTVIGGAFATIYSALNVPVTLIKARPTILDFIDRDTIDNLLHKRRDRGMTLRLGASVAAARGQCRSTGKVADTGPGKGRPSRCCHAGKARRMRFRSVTGWLMTSWPHSRGCAGFG